MTSRASAAGKITFFVDSLRPGGVQRSTVILANTFVERGQATEIVTCEEGDAFAAERDPRVTVVPLAPASEPVGRLAALRADPLGLWPLARPLLLARRPTRIAPWLPPLAAHLAAAKPQAVIAATPSHNIIAVLARRLAGWRGPVVLTERTAPSEMLRDGGEHWRKRFLPGLMHRLYPEADAIVSISSALGDDLAATAHLPRGLIRAIYNPIVGPDLAGLAAAPVAHAWLAPGQPPVVLGVGRLDVQKDFPTLIRAFARLRSKRPARLIILGATRDPARTAERQRELRELAVGLGVGDDVDLPGWVTNPFAWLAKAALFGLSSRYEGLPAVLVQALACGCPAASTDCPAGPREVLLNGALGPLVPVGDHEALGEAMARVLADPPPRDALLARAADFTVDASADHYLRLLDALGRARGR